MKYKEYPKYLTPPFDIEGLKEVKAKKRIDRGEFVSHDTGETFRASWWEEAGVKQVDSRLFLKVYKVGLVVLSHLSYPGLLVLIEIMNRLKPHSDKVELKQKEVVRKYKNLRGAGYYKGMCELLEYGVIAKSKEQGVFFINTNMFFNGDRLKWKKQNNN
jgi:hypothetical protein